MPPKPANRTAGGTCYLGALVTKRSILCICVALIALMGGLVPAHASHDDGSYDLPVWFYWNKSELDVLIVPPAHGQLVNDDGVLAGGDPSEATPFNSYLHAIETSIADWDRAVQTFGSESLRAGLDIRPYVVGRDQIPSGALTQPEVVVVNDETKGLILGLAFSTRPCIVDNSMWFGKSFSYQDMYNVNAQEFGHCLGLEHVVDGHPEHDAMNGTYQHSVGARGTHYHCPSNLDVAGLELVFGGVLGTGSGTVASVPVASYQAVGCPGGEGEAPEGAEPSPSPSGSPSPEPSESPAPSPSSSPSPTPSASPSPEPSASPSPEPPHRHSRSVTLRLRRHLVAQGAVHTGDDHDRCSAFVRVVVQRRNGDAWRKVATTSTRGDGYYRARVPDRRGMYRVVVPRSTHVDATGEHVCIRTASRRARHAH